MGILGFKVEQQFRRDTAQVWVEKNPVLSEGEPGLELDTGKMKMGDGVSAWNALPVTIYLVDGMAASHVIYHLVAQAGRIRGQWA